jgi:hypothetical protein
VTGTSSRRTGGGGGDEDDVKLKLSRTYVSMFFVEDKYLYAATVAMEQIQLLSGLDRLSNVALASVSHSGHP